MAIILLIYARRVLALEELTARTIPKYAWPLVSIIIACLIISGAITPQVFA
jgi:hypothetical protein